MAIARTFLQHDQRAHPGPPAQEWAREALSLDLVCLGGEDGEVNEEGTRAQESEAGVSTSRHLTTCKHPRQ